MLPSERVHRYSQPPVLCFESSHWLFPGPGLTISNREAENLPLRRVHQVLGHLVIHCDFSFQQDRSIISRIEASRYNYSENQLQILTHHEGILAMPKERLASLQNGPIRSQRPDSSIDESD